MLVQRQSGRAFDRGNRSHQGAVAMARKGITDRVLNALDLTAFRAHIEARKRSKGRENLSAA